MPAGSWTLCVCLFGVAEVGKNSVCHHLQTNQTPKCHPSTRPLAPVADVLSKSHLRVEINRLLKIDRSCTKVRPQHTNISRVRRM